MSTLLYESLTRARESTGAGKPLVLAEQIEGEAAEKKQDVNKFVDSVAALVPAEALAAHALIYARVTRTEETESDVLTVTIIHPTEAWIGWLVCLALTFFLYVAPHVLKRAFGRGDVVRMVIPPMAFVAWTLVLETSLFDAVDDWTAGTRVVVGVGVGGLALVLSRIFADKAEEESGA
jgi:hypothetical protein